MTANWAALWGEVVTDAGVLGDYGVGEDPGQDCTLKADVVRLGRVYGTVCDSRLLEMLYSDLSPVGEICTGSVAEFG